LLLDFDTVMNCDNGFSQTTLYYLTLRQKPQDCDISLL